MASDPELLTQVRSAVQLLLRKNIPYSFPIRVSNFDLHIDFCRMGRYATVCSRSHLRRVIDQPTAELEVYGVRGSKNRLDVELIEHRDAQPLAYRTAFAQLLGRYVLDEDGTELSSRRGNKPRQPQYASSARLRSEAGAAVCF